jgi:hypothetical protein
MSEYIAKIGERKLEGLMALGQPLAHDYETFRLASRPAAIEGLRTGIGFNIHWLPTSGELSFREVNHGAFGLAQSS